MLPLSELDGKGYTVSCRHAGVARLRFRLVAHIDPVIFVENVFPEDNHLPAAAILIPRAQVHQAVRVRLVGMGNARQEDGGRRHRIGEAVSADNGVLAGLSMNGRTQDGFAIGTYRTEEHTSELQSLMRISYAVFCLKKKKRQ